MHNLKVGMQSHNTVHTSKKVYNKQNSEHCLLDMKNLSLRSMDNSVKICSFGNYYTGPRYIFRIITCIIVIIIIVVVIVIIITCISGMTVRDIVLQFKHKIVLLFKLIMLERRV